MGSQFDAMDDSKLKVRHNCGRTELQVQICTLLLQNLKNVLVCFLSFARKKAICQRELSTKSYCVDRENLVEELRACVECSTYSSSKAAKRSCKYDYFVLISILCQQELLGIQ